MSSSCPDCGNPMEFAEREVRLRTGQCSGCGHEFTLVVGSAISPPGPVPVTAGAEGPGETGPVPEGTPECADCGSPLLFRVRDDGSLEARCDSCDTTEIYVARSAAPREERPARRERSFAPPGGGPMGPRSRPCRQCGAPLRFTTNEEGLLVGECEACGNRFTLPPRTEGGRREGGFGRDDRGSRGRRFGPPSGRSKGGRSYAPRGRSFRRYDSDEAPRDRDRRRRRREPEE